MAERLDNLIKSVRVVLGERRRLERIEKKIVKALNRALSRIGYTVVPAKAAAPGGRRPRRARRGAGRSRGRRRGAARRGRRRTGGGRRRARAKK